MLIGMKLASVLITKECNLKLVSQKILFQPIGQKGKKNTVKYEVRSWALALRFCSPRSGAQCPWSERKKIERQPGARSAMIFLRSVLRLREKKIVIAMG